MLGLKSKIFHKMMKYIFNIIRKLFIIKDLEISSHFINYNIPLLEIS